jgi:hypothetical protein
MAESKKKPEPPPPVLDYHALDGGATSSLFGCLGGFVSIAASCISGFSLYRSLSYTTTPTTYFSSSLMADFMPMAAGLAPPALVLIAAVMFRSTRRRNSFLIGTLIGAGLFGLLLGMCGFLLR